MVSQRRCKWFFVATWYCSRVLILNHLFTESCDDGIASCLASYWLSVALLTWPGNGAVCVVLRHFVTRDTVATASLEGGLGVRDTKLHGWSLFRRRNQLGSGLEMALRTSFYTPFCKAKSCAHSFFRRRHRFESGVENAPFTSFCMLL